jgi:hypothetical protein
MSRRSSLYRTDELAIPSCPVLLISTAAPDTVAGEQGQIPSGGITTGRDRTVERSRPDGRVSVAASGEARAQAIDVLKRPVAESGIVRDYPVRIGAIQRERITAPSGVPVSIADCRIRP